MGHGRAVRRVVRRVVRRAVRRAVVEPLQGRRRAVRRDDAGPFVDTMQGRS